MTQIHCQDKNVLAIHGPVAYNKGNTKSIKEYTKVYASLFM